MHYPKTANVNFSVDYLRLISWACIFIYTLYFQIISIYAPFKIQIFKFFFVSQLDPTMVLMSFYIKFSNEYENDIKLIR